MACCLYFGQVQSGLLTMTSSFKLRICESIFTDHCRSSTIFQSPSYHISSTCSMSHSNYLKFNRQTVQSWTQTRSWFENKNSETRVTILMHRHNSFKSQGITVHWFSAQSCMEWAWDDEQRKHEYAGKTIGKWKWIRNLSQVRDLQVANPSRKECAFP